MRPENTIPAFRYAIKQGVNALELDMAVTKDKGSWSCLTIPSSSRRSALRRGDGGLGPIHTLTFAQVRGMGLRQGAKPAVSEPADRAWNPHAGAG